MKQSLNDQKDMAEPTSFDDFILPDGKRISTIEQMAGAVMNADEQTFIAHVNEHKNDIATWVEHVFSQKELAESLRKTSDKFMAYVILKNFLRKRNIGGKEKEVHSLEKTDEAQGSVAANAKEKPSESQENHPKEAQQEQHAKEMPHEQENIKPIGEDKNDGNEEKDKEKDEPQELVEKKAAEEVERKDSLPKPDVINEVYHDELKENIPKESEEEIGLAIKTKDEAAPQSVHYDPVHLPREKVPMMKKIKRFIKKISRKKPEKDDVKKGDAELNEALLPDSGLNSEVVEEEPALIEFEYIKTGVPGFDEMITNGIPKGSSVLLCGGAGTGKTTFSLQVLNDAAQNKEKCLYLTFEEDVPRLRTHMKNYGWDPIKLEKEGYLKIRKMDPFDISRSVEALLAKASGELIIDIDEVEGVLPSGYHPDKIVLDSLSAVAAAFVGKEEGYRIYVEQLFSLFKKIGATSFLISEVEENTNKYTRTGVEEFLADAVIVFYNLRQKNVRVSAVEIIKIRGTSFQKKIVPFKIMAGRGMTVFPKEDPFLE